MMSELATAMQTPRGAVGGMSAWEYEVPLDTDLCEKKARQGTDTRDEKSCNPKMDTLHMRAF